MTEARTTSSRTTSSRTGRTGTVLQLMLGLALAADLIFLGLLGFRLSDRVEQTGLAMAGMLTLALIAVLFRLTRRISVEPQAVEPG
jgi:hypothetical protein